MRRRQIGRGPDVEIEQSLENRGHGVLHWHVGHLPWSSRGLIVPAVGEGGSFRFLPSCGHRRGEGRRRPLLGDRAYRGSGERGGEHQTAGTNRGDEGEHDQGKIAHG